MENRKRAFTLIEMMAVVVIIGILAAVIGPKLFNQVSTTQVTAAQQDIAVLKKAVTLYRFNTNRFPEELRDLVKRPDEDRGWRGPYVDKLPRDPWNNDYQYSAPGQDDREFDIWSLGQDGKEGGEGLDADIVSWQEEE